MEHGSHHDNLNHGPVDNNSYNPFLYQVTQKAVKEFNEIPLSGSKWPHDTSDAHPKNNSKGRRVSFQPDSVLLAEAEFLISQSEENDDPIVVTCPFCRTPGMVTSVKKTVNPELKSKFGEYDAYFVITFLFCFFLLYVANATLSVPVWVTRGIVGVAVLIMGGIGMVQFYYRFKYQDVAHFCGDCNFKVGVKNGFAEYHKANAGNDYVLSEQTGRLENNY